VFPSVVWASYTLLEKKVMLMKNRKRQRENKKLKSKEEMLDKRNGCGIKDLTAYNAVLQIRTQGKAAIVLK